MRKIEMVDLGMQYAAIKKEVNAAIQGVLDSTAFIRGGEVSTFEKELAEYTGAQHVISCANGTDALQIAFMALGLEPGDEIITPTFTYIATAEAAALLHLKPVLVDVDPDTFCMDIAALEKAISHKTRVIVPVHLYGQCANMEEINRVAKKHGLYVVEDTAQAIGSVYAFSDGKKYQAGTMGTIGVTSFFPSKNLGCYGDGGALFVNNDELAQQIKMIANHGQAQKYIHDIIGVNSRLDTLQAAVLRVKLKHLDEYSRRRNEVAAYYDQAFATSEKVRIPHRNPSSSHVFHQYTLTLKGVDREALRDYLQAQGIPTMVYYPLPLHKQKAFAPYLNTSQAYPVADELCKQVLSLPIHTEMEAEQLEYITQHVLSFITQ